MEGPMDITLDVEQPLLVRTPTKNKAISGIVNHDAPLRTRFVDRRGRFRQSLGRYNIVRKGGDWRKIYYDDSFHTVLNTSTPKILFGIFFIYLLTIMGFGVLYMRVSYASKDCHVGLSNYMQAYLFSLQTIMTIGYSAPQDDIFFGNCLQMATILSLESFAGIFLDSICIGLFFARFSRANSRANTILFSNAAIIRKIRGHFYLMFQVCERRKHQLVEAHIRLYAVRHDYNSVSTSYTNPERLFQCHQMRIQQPDDELGATLLMALPQVIVHRIDPWSPLFPPECLPPKQDEGQYQSFTPAYPDPKQRQVDLENGNREGHSEQKPFQEPTRRQIVNHLRQSEVEVVAILEGIDCSTSSTTQARHSYAEQDIAWDSTFQNCVQKTDKGVVIDFNRFHVLDPVPENVDHCSAVSMF